MRHLKKGRKFGRMRGQRRALLRGLMQHLILNERIATTEARAKELKPTVEKLVSLAKKQTISALRILIARLSKRAALKLYYDLVPRYRERSGGYLRIIRTSKHRVGDASQRAIIEFI